MRSTVEELPDTIDAKESDYLYLKSSGIINSGKGLFTSIPIYQNEVISLFKGEILGSKEAAFRALHKNDGYFINMLDGSIMDSMHIKCFAKYANDSEGFKATNYKNNSKISLDENNNVCLVATKNIKSSEEIFCGYGKDYWKNFKKR